MNDDSTRFFAGDPPRHTRFCAGEPSPPCDVSVRPPLLVRLVVGAVQRVLAGLAVAAFVSFQSIGLWNAWYLRYKYDPPRRYGPLYFLINASTADDWIGYTLLAAAAACFLAFVVWPRRWTALLACLAALTWAVPGCNDALRNLHLP